MTNGSPNDTSTILSNYMSRAQYNALTAVNSSRGTNLIRLVVTGSSCSTQAGPPEPCGGFQGAAERMPFSVKSGQYNIQMLNSSNVATTDGSQLSTKWKTRLQNFLKYADRNGIAVKIDLFDENNLGSPNNQWANNPWNPSNNNIDSAPANCTLLNNLPKGGLPNLYKIFNANGSLNCLGKIQKNYVYSVVNFVRRAKACGNGGTSQCKNVIFQVMNEARFDGTWSNFSTSDFQKWHNQIGLWIRTHGEYLVAANVKGPSSGLYEHPCSTANRDDSCLLANCTATSCPPRTFNGTTFPNYFTVFLSPEIKITTLHSRSWIEGNTTGDICAKDQDALGLKKPVIYDNDGDNVLPRKSDLNESFIQKWAQQVSQSGTNSCGRAKGFLHLYDTKDAAVIEPNGTTPTKCRYDDVLNPTPYVDCFAWNALADGVPEKFCGSATGLTACVTRTNYCENFTGTPDFCTPVQDAQSTNP